MPNLSTDPSFELEKTSRALRFIYFGLGKAYEGRPSSLAWALEPKVRLIPSLAERRSLLNFCLPIADKHFSRSDKRGGRCKKWPMGKKSRNVLSRLLWWHTRLDRRWSFLPPSDENKLCEKMQKNISAAVLVARSKKPVKDDQEQSNRERERESPVCVKVS